MASQADRIANIRIVANDVARELFEIVERKLGRGTDVSVDVTGDAALVSFDVPYVVLNASGPVKHIERVLVTVTR